MGLCLSRKKLAWTYDGFGSKWIHKSILKLIARIWNSVSCRLFGHFWFSLKKDTYEVCVDCMKKKGKNK